MTHSLAKLNTLKLDPFNPRFEKAFTSETNSVLILQELFKESDVLSIVNNVLQQDFDLVEPIVVTKDTDNTWLVLEGNRRTAAFMICSDIKYAREVSLDIQSTLSPTMEIPIYIYETREAAQKYLHKRHVSKPYGWKPYAKNQFLYNSYTVIEPNKFHRNSIEKLAKDYEISVPNIYSALVCYLVFEEIKKYDFFYFLIDTKKIDYSVFTTALANPSIRDYLGLERDLNKYHDVSFTQMKRRINIDSLRIFTKIVFDKSYGKSGNKAILDDSRKVTKLGEIFDCDKAVKELLNTKNIDAVYSRLSDLRLSISTSPSSNTLSAPSTPPSSSTLPAPSTPPNIQLEPIKPFFSTYVSKKIYGLYKQFMESVDKETASANVSPLIDYLHKFKK